MKKQNLKKEMRRWGAWWNEKKFARIKMAWWSSLTLLPQTLKTLREPPSLFFFFFCPSKISPYDATTMRRCSCTRSPSFSPNTSPNLCSSRPPVIKFLCFRSLFSLFSSRVPPLLLVTTVNRFGVINKFLYHSFWSTNLINHCDFLTEN